ncbi:MAG: AHH domain-containing protein, partial [Pirellulales bacterium]
SPEVRQPLIDKFVRAKTADEARQVITELTNLLPTEIHHMMTNKGIWGPRFAALLKKAGIDFNLDDVANKIDLPGHLGKHISEYHQWIYGQVETALAGKSGDEALQALLGVLKKIRDALEQNPRLPYIEGGLRL